MGTSFQKKDVPIFCCWNCVEKYAVPRSKALVLRILPDRGERFRVWLCIQGFPAPTVSFSACAICANNFSRLRSRRSWKGLPMRSDKLSSRE